MGECVCRIQITSPVRSGFFFSGISSRPIAGFIEVMEGFEEVPSVLCFLQLFEMYTEGGGQIEQLMISPFNILVNISPLQGSVAFV
jgi:hypothetical protein